MSGRRAPPAGRIREAARGAALAAAALTLALPPGAASAHAPFGISDPWLAGALGPAVFPERAAALGALAALAARQAGGGTDPGAPGAGSATEIAPWRRAGPATALCAAAGLALGAAILLLARWGFWPGGATAPVTAGLAGLAALAPWRWPGAALAAGGLAGGAALGLSMELHPPLGFAARLAAGGALGGILALGLLFALLRALPEAIRGVVCAVVGAWAAAAALMGLAFRLAAG